MSQLLDVNVLLACDWVSYWHHAADRRRLEKQTAFATCPFTEAWFRRVSLDPGCHARFAHASDALSDITSRRQARFVAADPPTAEMVAIPTPSEATDAYLVSLAKKRKLKLATLDDALCVKPWTESIARNPLAPAR